MNEIFLEMLGAMLVAFIAGIVGVVLIVALEIEATAMQGSLLVGGVVFTLYATQEIGKLILKRQSK